MPKDRRIPSKSEEMDEYFRRRGEIRWSIAPTYAGASFMLTSIGVSAAMKFTTNLPWYIWMPVGIVAGIAASIFGYRVSKYIYDSRNTVSENLALLTSNSFQYDNYGSPLETYILWALKDEGAQINEVFYATEIMRIVFLDHSREREICSMSLRIKPKNLSQVPLLENTKEFMKQIDSSRLILDTDDPISLLQSIVRNPTEAFKPSNLIERFKVHSKTTSLYGTPTG